MEIEIVPHQALPSYPYQPDGANQLPFPPHYQQEIHQDGMVQQGGDEASLQKEETAKSLEDVE